MVVPAYLSAVRLARSKHITRIVNIKAEGILQMVDIAGISATPARVVRDWNGSFSEPL